MDDRSVFPDAVAVVRGNEKAPRLGGAVHFFQKARGVWVVAHVYGLPRDTGFFAFHIHEGRSCTGVDFAAAGGHYNPGRTQHPYHAGDLPPLLSCDGEGFLAVLTNGFRVRDIIGRTVVIHSDPDDFHTQPAGNSGAKIACGVIRSRRDEEEEF